MPGLYYIHIHGTGMYVEQKLEIEGFMITDGMGSITRSGIAGGEEHERGRDPQ